MATRRVKMSTEDFKALEAIANIVQSLVTAAAFVVGGAWTYFKLVKGRTFRPRVEVNLFGQWRAIDGTRFLHTRITVKNIGLRKIGLLQSGTALVVNGLVQRARSRPAASEWRPFGAFSILRDHAWIEPGELVSDDHLLDLLVTEPVPVLLHARLNWHWSYGKKNIVVVARKVLPVETRIDGVEAAVPAGPASVVPPPSEAQQAVPGVSLQH